MDSLGTGGDGAIRLPAHYCRIPRDCRALSHTADSHSHRLCLLLSPSCHPLPSSLVRLFPICWYLSSLICALNGSRNAAVCVTLRRASRGSARVKEIAVRKRTRWRQRESESARCIWRRTLLIIYYASCGPVLTHSWIMYPDSGNRPNSEATVLIMTAKTLKTCAAAQMKSIIHRSKSPDISSWNYNNDC